MKWLFTVLAEMLKEDVHGHCCCWPERGIINFVIICVIITRFSMIKQNNKQYFILPSSFCQLHLKKKKNPEITGFMWFNSSYNTLKTYHCYYWWEGWRCLLSRDSLCIKRSGPWWSLCMGRPGSRSCSTWHSWRAEDPTGRGSASHCGPGAPGDRRKSPRFHTLLHTWKWKKTEVTLKKKKCRQCFSRIIFNFTF